MPYVYILAENEEHGIETPWVATLDRIRLADLMEAKWPEYVKPFVQEWPDRREPDGMHRETVDVIANLAALLANSDDDLSKEGDREDRTGGHPLGLGWGGPKLYILRLS